MHKLYFREPAHQTLQINNMRLYSLTYIHDIPSWHYASHSHTALEEIMFIESGTGVYTLDSVPYDVEAGDVIFVNAGVVHSECQKSEDFRMWCCSFGGVSFYGLDAEQIIPRGMCPILKSGDLAPYLSERFRTLYQERLFPQIHTDELSKLIMGDVLLHLSRSLHSAPQEIVESTEETLSDQVKRYIDAHYAEQITLESLSKEFYVSTYYINHEMKNKLGISPINYLISRRIGEAQRLLLSTDLKISEIARQVGYDNAYHFTSLFKKNIGCSPQFFRQTYDL